MNSPLQIFKLGVSKSPRLQSYRNQCYNLLSSEKAIASMTVVPVILLYTFITIVPILYAIYAGFFNIHAYSPDWTWVGIEHYVTITNDTDFFLSFWRSIIYASVSVILQLVFGLAIALALNRKLKYQNFIRTIIILPYLIPTAIIGFVALWMGNSQYGIFNQLLYQVGIVENYRAWFGDPDLAMPAVIITGNWKFTIFVTIMVLAKLQSISDIYYESAKMAGATTYQIFRDITLPNLKGVIFIVVLLRGVWMINKFDIIYVLTRGGPADRTTTVPIYAFEVAFAHHSLGQAAAISTVLFLFLVIAALIYFRVVEPSKEVRVE